LLCNTFYFLAASKQNREVGRKDILLGMIQAEADLVILTAILHFSGGVVNPFVLFYIFHVIISTIILPRNLSVVVGFTAILLFGLLAVNELNGGTLQDITPEALRRRVVEKSRVYSGRFYGVFLHGGSRSVFNTNDYCTDGRQRTRGGTKQRRAAGSYKRHV
jgi:hypothetical protein